jgi:ubiquinone/menaquinone biosynthesis C-methylase UbiE
MTDPQGFDLFYLDKHYIAFKNSSFNYWSRKRAIKKCFRKNTKDDEDMVLVDIGCGISPVSPKPEHTLFLDRAAEALKHLQQKGYSTKQGDITKLPLEAGFADVVFCSEVLEHVEDYNAALKEIHRILKTGGKLILTVPVHAKYWGSDDSFVGHLTRFELDSFTKLLAETGFEIVEEKPIGSWLERKITRRGVKVFMRQKSKEPFGQMIVLLSRVVNCIAYLAVLISLLFTSKESTSIMLYCCRKE